MELQVQANLLILHLCVCEVYGRRIMRMKWAVCMHKAVSSDAAGATEHGPGLGDGETSFG